jgi:uncharacterized surface protein with fasciclin (FAS1) repeats
MRISGRVEKNGSRRKENMKKIASLFLALGCTFAVLAADNPMVGGAPMYANKNIVENAINSKDHTTLVAAVKAAGLVDTLEGTGPFTVFAPTNEAFAKLPAGTVDTLLKPENKATLVKILTYHVLPGKYTAAKLKKEVMKDGGTASIKTVEGDALTFTMDGADLVVKDEKGMTAHITVANVMQSNGVIHVIDTVLQPN